MPGFQSFNCRSGKSNPTLYHSDSLASLDRCLTSSVEAHESGALKDNQTRIQLLQTILSHAMAKKEVIAKHYCEESSLDLVRFEVEFERCLEQISHFIQSLLHSEPSIDLLSDRRIEKRSIAMGPVAVFGASNFPLAYATLGGDVMGALAAGCPVIVKGHPYHPGTSLICAEVIHDAVSALHLPQGVFGHVLDDGFSLAESLVADPRIKAVGFTGSFKGGMALFRLAQQREEPIPFFAEMGSLNPVIIHPSVSGLEKHVKNLALAVANEAGQYCTKPGLVFCPEEIWDEALGMFSTFLKGIEPHPMLHPAIHSNYVGHLARLKKLANVSFEAEILPDHFGQKAFLSLNIEEFVANPTFSEEVFGPFCIWVRYTSEESLQGAYKKLKGQLTTTFLGAEDSLSPQWRNQLENHCGRLVFNGVPTGVKIVKSMHHGGPFPSTTDPRFSAVGMDSMKRFQRNIAVQNTL